MRRIRLVVDALAAGGGVAVLAIAALIVAGETPARATELAFAVGALALGVGLLGWSGSVMAGRGIETIQGTLDTNTDWTEAKSRRAMARVGGFGGGLMITSAIVEAVASGP